MGHSSLLGTEEAPIEAPGRDAAALGPGDNSDSGSDMMGITEDDSGGDADLPVDVALRDDNPHSFESEGSAGSTSDAAGTGERRSAASDAGREAADIGVDRIVAGPDLHEVADDEDVSDDEDADLAFVDDAQAGDPVEDEDEDELDEDGDAAERDPDNQEEDDNIPRGRSGTARTRAQTPTPPGRPNPEPDVPAPTPGDSDEEIPPPADEQDSEERKPGRTAALLRRR